MGPCPKNLFLSYFWTFWLFTPCPTHFGHWRGPRENFLLFFSSCSSIWHVTFWPLTSPLNPVLYVICLLLLHQHTKCRLKILINAPLVKLLTHLNVDPSPKILEKAQSVCLFCCFMSQSTAMVMGGRSVHLTTLFPGKVSNGAKIRNRYNQVPHLTQDTNGKVTNSQKTPQTRAKRSALSQLEQAVNHLFMHILSLVTDNNTLEWISRREENDRRNYFMINLHKSMGPGQDQTRDPWICSQTRYRLPYATQ